MTSASVSQPKTNPTKPELIASDGVKPAAPFKSQADDVIQAGSVRLCCATGDVEIDGQRVHFTAKEAELLELLMRRKNQIVTREMFLNVLYRGKREPALKIFDVLICKIRGKLRSAANGHEYIETVWGRGYRIQEPIEKDTAA